MCCDRCGGVALHDGDEPVCILCGHRPMGFGKVRDHNTSPPPLTNYERYGNYRKTGPENAAYQREWRAKKKARENPMIQGWAD